MKKISTREEANNYYKSINKAVDDFASKTKSRPSEMHKYIFNNRKVFLKRLELDDIEGIDNVLTDVLSHRKHMEDDQIITFEKYSRLNESIFEISPPTIDYEKTIADYFNTSLGHIDLIDSNTHLYKVNDFGKEVYCVILSSSDIDVLKKKVSQNIREEISNKIINLDSVGEQAISRLSFWLSDFIDQGLLSSYVDSKVSTGLIFEIVSKELSVKNEFIKGGLHFEEFNGFFVSSI